MSSGRLAVEKDDRYAESQYYAANVDHLRAIFAHV